MKVSEIYQKYINDGKIKKNEKQQKIAQNMDLFIKRIIQKNDMSWLQKITKTKPGISENTNAGIYIWGPPGNGKTMIMDIAVQSAKKNGIKTQRIHFHQFMQNIHEHIHQKKQHDTQRKPIPEIVRNIKKNTQLICLDEFEVIDITDAMILKRLFEAMMRNQIVTVITSNTEPKKLYQNGLNRQLFLPFIKLIEKNMQIITTEGIKDYRKQFLNDNNRYFYPLNQTTKNKMDHIWERLTEGKNEHQRIVRVKKRNIYFERCYGNKMRTTFTHLCDQPLGAGDYIEIVKHFQTILIEDIPLINKQKRNQARRFITLIDTLYDTRKCLIISAQAGPEKLWQEKINQIPHERTISRLIEMNTPKWGTNP